MCDNPIIIWKMIVNGNQYNFNTTPFNWVHVFGRYCACKSEKCTLVIQCTDTINYGLGQIASCVLSTKETVLGDVGGRNRCTALPYFPFACMCI